jgi:hypothetical protein
MKERNKEQGQVLMITVILFTAAAVVIIFGITSPVIRQIQISRDLETSKRSYFVAEAGSEDAYYRIKNNLPTSFPAVMSLDGVTATITTSVTGSNEQEILSQGNANNLIRTVKKDITLTDGFSFNFAVQVGLGGLRMQNDSDVIGNVYSNGPIKGDDRDKNFIVGDAVSAGSSGSIEKIHATSSAYANSIKNSKIDKDAYYQTIDSGTVVTRTKYPDSADQPLSTMPILDTLLDQWEASAVSGGVISSPCPYVIDSSVTLGPIKIDCNVRVKKNDTVVTLAGTVWVNGDINIDDRPKFKVSDSLGNKSVPVIARSVADPLNKGIIDLDDKPTFFGSETGGVPNPDSYVMFVSRNTSAENGGSVKAISAGNHVTGNLLLYAPHGLIVLSNNVILRGVTAYSLNLKNNTQVYYTVGLAQPLFVSGPGGKWKIKRWKEVKN